MSFGTAIIASIWNSTHNSIHFSETYRQGEEHNSRVMWGSLLEEYGVKCWQLQKPQMQYPIILLHTTHAHYFPTGVNSPLPSIFMPSPGVRYVKKNLILWEIEWHNGIHSQIFLMPFTTQIEWHHRPFLVPSLTPQLFVTSYKECTKWQKSMKSMWSTFWSGCCKSFEYSNCNWSYPTVGEWWDG